MCVCVCRYQAPLLHHHHHASKCPSPCLQPHVCFHTARYHPCKGRPRKKQGKNKEKTKSPLFHSLMGEGSQEYQWVEDSSNPPQKNQKKKQHKRKKNRACKQAPPPNTLQNTTTTGTTHRVIVGHTDTQVERHRGENTHTRGGGGRGSHPLQTLSLTAPVCTLSRRGHICIDLYACVLHSYNKYGGEHE